MSIYYPLDSNLSAGRRDGDFGSRPWKKHKRKALSQKHITARWIESQEEIDNYEEEEETDNEPEEDDEEQI